MTQESVPKGPKTQGDARTRHVSVWGDGGHTGVRTPYLWVPGLRPRPLGQAARPSTLGAVTLTPPAPLAPGLPFVAV